MIPFLRRSKNLYIHIGLHKTGTTSIQLFMHKNCEIIRKKYGVSYNPIPSDDIVPYQHRYLNKLMIWDEDAFFKIFKNNSKSGCNFVISSECFVEKEEYAVKLSKLKDVFDETFIIVYLRRQDEWVESLYKQAITYNHKINFTIDEWVEMFLSNGYLFYNADFLKTLDRWASLFGKDSIILRSFDKQQLHDGNIVSDFCKIFKVSASKLNNNLIHANVGVQNREIIEMYRLTNGQIDLKGQSELAGKMIINESDNKSFLSPQQKEAIIEHFETTNKKISSEYYANKKLFSELEDDYKWSKFNGLSFDNHKIIDEYLLGCQS